MDEADYGDGWWGGSLEMEEWWLMRLKMRRGGGTFDGG